MAHETPLGACLIPGCDCVVDLHARTGKLALERERMEKVTRQPRG